MDEELPPMTAAMVTRLQTAIIGWDEELAQLRGSGAPIDEVVRAFLSFQLELVSAVASHSARIEWYANAIHGHLDLEDIAVPEVDVTLTARLGDSID